MTIYIVEGFDFSNPNEQNLSKIKIQKNTVVYQNESGRLGFDSDSKALSNILFDGAKIFLYENNETYNSNEAELLPILRKNLETGAFIFFEVTNEFEKHVNDLDKYKKYLVKKKMFEKFKKETVDKIENPLLKSFYNNNKFDPKYFKVLLSHCSCCFYTKYSDYGIYFYIYSLGQVDFLNLFSTKYILLDNKADIPCW